MSERSAQIREDLKKAVEREDPVGIIIAANALRLRIPQQGVRTDIPSPEPAA